MLVHSEHRRRGNSGTGDGEPPKGLPPRCGSVRWINLFYLPGQAERCRRLAHSSTDAGLSDSLLKLAEEYTARDGTAVRLADADDQGTE